LDHGLIGVGNITFFFTSWPFGGKSKSDYIKKFVFQKSYICSESDQELFIIFEADKMIGRNHLIIAFDTLDN
jgi:hypothetical protein